MGEKRRRRKHRAACACDLRDFDVAVNDLICKDCGYCREVCSLGIFKQSEEFQSQRLQTGRCGQYGQVRRLPAVSLYLPGFCHYDPGEDISRELIPLERKLELTIPLLASGTRDPQDAEFIASRGRAAKNVRFVFCSRMRIYPAHA